MRAWSLAICGALALENGGCSLIAAGQVQPKVLSALNDGQPDAAARALDDALGVPAGKIPVEQHAFTGLMLAERGTVQLAAGFPHQSTDDLRVADKMLDVSDLALDDTMRRMVLPSSRRHAFHMGWFGALNYPYVPRLHERLMVNPLAMIGYLDLGDDGSARVEARRLDVMIDFATRASASSPAFATRALSGILAGFAFEQSGEAQAACREYRAAVTTTGADFSTLVPGGKSPAICDAEDGAGDPRAGRAQAALPASGEILIVIAYGIVPHAELTSGSPPTYVLSGGNDAAEEPKVTIDGEQRTAVETLQLADVVRGDWDQATREVYGSTTPLSWCTLPARFALVRAKVAPGHHAVTLSVRAVTQKKDLLVPAGSYAATSLFVLR